MAREFPAKLLGDFEAHALGAFGVVGAEVHIHEAPAVFAGDLRAKAVDLIIGAFDADDLRAVNQRADDFALLQVCWNEDIACQAGGGGIGGHGVCEIARGGAGDDFEAEFAGAAESDGNHAVFEREGGVVDRVVFDIKFIHSEVLGESVGPDEWRESNLSPDSGCAVDR